MLSMDITLLLELITSIVPSVLIEVLIRSLAPHATNLRMAGGAIFSGKVAIIPFLGLRILISPDN